ncbi:transposase [Lentibacillus sp. Marseille-P4043]|uniref:transposase n=1 Tax=Lentibacillus sp. Marseille-P4043 TaxID=2040293 RepID=UPI000D0AD38D|nr:transposase [Lentibacillus sp. Marseille-P4043]
MTRIPRRKSTNGIYHIMLRGINRQTIFEDDEDKLRLLSTIKRFKGKDSFELFAYCLMDNHIHLLIKEAEESISKTIQRISASYVYWYNNKYERFGHLFQERFKSENVDTIAYFFTVLRYIHQNPVKAGIANNAFACEWTSIHEYYGRANLVTVDFVFQLISPNRNKATQLFTEYMLATNDDECLDNDVKVKRSDSEVKRHLANLGIPNNTVLQQMEKQKRNKIISELRGLEGITIRQLARITGISKSVIHRIQ